MAEAFSHSAGYYPGPLASQIMTPGQEQLLVEKNPHDSFKQVFVLSSHPVEVCVAGEKGVRM